MALVRASAIKTQPSCLRLEDEDGFYHEFNTLVEELRTQERMQETLLRQEIPGGPRTSLLASLASDETARKVEQRHEKLQSIRMLRQRVLTADERRTIGSAAGSGRSVSSDDSSKWDEVCSLRTGRPAQAASGLWPLMCVDEGEANSKFFRLLSLGVDGIEKEVKEFVSAFPDDPEVREVGELLHYILH
mmetsp:Transcript_41068/g.95923  ORF Transcript_41068/g.95923 Transcript_41068/m.95923 type:complete len:189 (-) Transcript_41068:319-885(-)